MEKLRMHPHQTKGLLITFCGLDGCGKTSMIRALSTMLQAQGHTLLLTKQPTDFVRNSNIFRAYMDQPDHDAYDYRSLSLLAASDRVQHVSHIIRPALEAGRIVISDRYFYSCLANLCARGYGQDKWIYEISESIIQPDIAFFLDVPVETAVTRVRSRENERNRYIDMKLQYQLREKYIEISGLNGGVLLSTRETEESTAFKIREKLSQLLKERPSGITKTDERFI